MGNIFNQNYTEMEFDAAMSRRYIHHDDINQSDVENKIDIDRTHVKCTKCNQKFSYCSNYIKTTKYSLYLFIFINLWEQFHKKANIYFLCDAIISLTPFSPKTPIVTVTPLVCVLGVTAIKEAYEDYLRYKMDKEVNTTRTLVFDKKKKGFVTITWQDIKVGDIVMVKQDQAFPCDLLLLKTSELLGNCSIQTANLDGETNLKNRSAIPETYSIGCDNKGEDYPLKFPPCIIQSSLPNKRLEGPSSWTGNLTRTSSDNSENKEWVTVVNEKISLGSEQLLLRGCTLRNTRWIIGMAMFTGNDTKVMLNNKQSPFKRSSVDRLVDKFLYFLFAIQFSLCSFGAISMRVWLDNSSDKYWYLPYVVKDFDIHRESGFNFLTFFVLLDVLIPISLYVTIEMVKFIQSWLISEDIEMYYSVTDTPARARTSNLNEELGQITHLFSDKTGTLTQNIMTFHSCSIMGKYHGPDNALSNKERSHDVDNFLTCLAACHTVIAEYPDCPSEEDHQGHSLETCPSNVRFDASSPDEKCLVEYANQCQYFFYFRRPHPVTIGPHTIMTSEEMHIKIDNVSYVFDVLEVFPFESSRARMSILVRDPRDNQIKLFCKGADSKLYSLIDEPSKSKIWPNVDQQLTQFSRIGLRTLVCAFRIISMDEFLKWWPKHFAAKSVIENREREVAKTIALMEAPNSLTLLGATAIEDKLQDGVPETISSLLKAGISVWMVTGDKTETAINIGKSCNLITPEMLDEKSSSSIQRIDVSDKLPPSEAKEATIEAIHNCYNRLNTLTDSALVVTGRALTFIFPDANAVTDKQFQDEVKKQFLEICLKVKSIICCRTSPIQKADIVQLIKTNVPNSVTAAIGDGANDVSMIKEAHVGIGISGLEGLQAVMSSDYAIGQFRFLQRLLLIHGAWSYSRISYVILYSFYKNIALTVNNIWFCLFNAFSGQMYFDPFAGACYNLIFTALPIMLCGVFNHDISADNSLKRPELYRQQRGNELTFKLLLSYVFLGLYQSVFLYFISNFAYGAISDPQGQDRDHWMAGSAMFTWLLFTVHLQVALNTKNWTKYHYIIMFFENVCWFAFLLGYSAFPLVGDHFGVGLRLLTQVDTWLYAIIVPFVLNLPEIVVRYVKRTYFPTLRDIVVELDRNYTDSDLTLDQKPHVEKGGSLN